MQPDELVNKGEEDLTSALDYLWQVIGTLENYFDCTLLIHTFVQVCWENTSDWQ